MIIKAFRGKSIEEALARVKAALGPSALIVETRKVTPRGPFGFFRKPVVEVVVGIEDTPSTPTRRPGALVPIDWAKELANLRSIEAEIGDVKDALRVLVESAPFDTSPAVRDLTLCLIEQGFDRHTAAAVAEEAHQEQARARGGAPLDHLRAVLARRFRCAPETPGPEAGARPGGAGAMRVVAFVGPTGAGKTTTLAKLASHLALQRGERVALATLDFFRVGAVEQLRAYAEILGTPLHVVPGPEAVPQVLEAARPAAWLLLDTPGLAYHDAARLERLAASLGAFPGVERHLVLSAAAEMQAALEAVEAFKRLGLDRLAFAKLDEARRGAILVAAAEAAEAPVSYLGTGQDVARDLEVAQPARLAQLVLCPSAATPVRQTQTAY